MARIMFICLTAALILGQGCPPPPDTCPAAAGGEWPEYAGRWSSITNAAGSKYSDWGWMDVTIHQDGTFTGNCRDYIFDYIWEMTTAWGRIPVSVYNPGGNSRQICGAINFDAGSATIQLQGFEVQQATLEIHSESQLAFVFGSGFPYTVINIQR